MFERQNVIHAFPIATFILALIYKWFAVDDRYAIFLYNHMRAQPFDEVTVGRYWMSGFVASAIVMLLYIATNFLLARIVKNYRAPEWWRVWLWCAAPVAIGVWLITTTQNSPTMPPAIAAAIAFTTLIGLALALMPGALAAHRPRELMWSAIDGLALVPILLLLRAVELTGGRNTIGGVNVYFIEIGIIIVGIGWLAATNIFRAWRRKHSPTAIQVFIVGLCWSYLVLPLVHYIFSTPPNFKYITASQNFFASALEIQIVSWLVAIALAVIATSVRQRVFNFRGEI